MLNRDDLESVVRVMREPGVGFSAGLSEELLCEAEAVLVARFPPDLRGLLAFAMPQAPREIELWSELEALDDRPRPNGVAHCAAARRRPSS